MPHALFTTGFALSIAGLMLSTSLGCSSDDDHDDGDGHGGTASHEIPAECQPIRDACHEKDVGEGRVHECHETSHNGTAADCTPIHDECVQVCNEAPFPDADAGHGGSGGTGGADHGGSGGMGGMDHGGSGGTG